jgi:hypothetical protein
LCTTARVDETVAVSEQAGQKGEVTLTKAMAHKSMEDRIFSELSARFRI